MESTPAYSPAASVLQHPGKMNSSVRPHPVHTIVQHRGLRQFVKFCIVGFSSTVISMGIYSATVYYFHLDRMLHNALAGSPGLQSFADRNQVYIQVAAFFGFLFGVTNGFVWNSRWTFKESNPALRHAQYVKFVLVNIVGLILNQIILFTVMRILTMGQPVLHSEQKDLKPLLAFMIATGIVVFWNFFANRHWTFKHGAAVPTDALGGEA